MISDTHQSLVDKVLEEVDQAQRQHILKQMLNVGQLLLEAHQGLFVADQLLGRLDCGDGQHLRATQEQPKGERFNGRKDQHDQHRITRTDIQRAQRGIAE